MIIGGEPTGGPAMRVVIIVSAAAALAAASPAAGKDYYDKSRDVKRIAWMDRGMDMVRSILKDGDSAKFRGVFFSDGGGVPTSCGEVKERKSVVWGKSGEVRVDIGGRGSIKKKK